MPQSPPPRHPAHATYFPSVSLFSAHPLPPPKRFSTLSSLSDVEFDDAVVAPACYRTAYVGLPLYESENKILSEVTNEELTSFVDYIMLSFLPSEHLRSISRPSFGPLAQRPSPVHPPLRSVPAPRTADLNNYARLIAFKPLPPRLFYVSGVTVQALGLPPAGRSSDRPLAIVTLREPWLPLRPSDKMRKITRRLLNWRRLVGVVMQEGFDVVVVNFDDMTMPDQIELTNRATVLIGAHGNNLSNILWAKRTSPMWLIEFSPFNDPNFINGINTNPGGNYGSFCRALGINHAGLAAPSHAFSPVSSSQYPTREMLSRPLPLTMEEALAEPDIVLPSTRWLDQARETYRFRDTVADLNWLRDVLFLVEEDWADAYKAGIR